MSRAAMPGTGSVPAADAPQLTSPAFDAWLDRQMKTLLLACSEPPSEALVALIRRECGTGVANPAAGPKVTD